MTELKTLKDLEKCSIIDCSSEFHQKGISSRELRQEAIKWIKSISKDGFDRNIKIETIEDASKQATIAILKAESDLVVQWIKNFFNITKEDLK